MMLRFLLTTSMLLAVTLSQRVRFRGTASSQTVDPAGILRIADRGEITKTASGLPQPKSGRRLPFISDAEFRRFVSQANETIAAREQSDTGKRRLISSSAPRRFPFGPQLLSSPTARGIGRSGELFVETSRRARQRVVAQGGTGNVLPRLSPGARNGLSCPFDQSISCDRTAKYRTITGVCNNLRNPLWGSANTPFERSAPSLYNDGISEPRSQSILSGDLPLPRLISTTIHEASGIRTLDTRFTHITMEFGQFVSHDIERFAAIQTPDGKDLVCCINDTASDQSGCLPITIPPRDPFFARFNRKCMEMVRALGTPPLSCELGPREQLNQESAYLDGSAVYGSTEDLANKLRLKRGGLLETTPSSDGELLLQDPDLEHPECRSQSGQQCFKAGDPRVNQQPALMSMHTLWLREHNRVARELSSLNPTWTDETLYQEARRIVSAEFQHVIYDEFLPVIVGEPVARAFDFPAKKFGYNTDYQESFNAQIRSAFSAAGYRFGHSLVQTFFADKLKFADHFLRPDTIYQSSKGPSFVIENLFSNKQQKCDRLISPQLTNTLFEQAPGTGIDLAATNIQRGRDFGIPSYNVFRVICGLQPVTHFGTSAGGLVDHTQRAADLLKQTYRHVDDIDLWTGAVSEKVIRGAVVGPTIACVIGRQFFLLKKGDRFFYENNDFYAKFPINQLNELRKTTFARIICDNTKAKSIQKEVFRYADSTSNPKVDCRGLPKLDLTLWGRCIDGGWSDWSPLTGCFSGFRFQWRYCNNPAPVGCGKPCEGRSFRYFRCGSRTRQSLDPLAVARRVLPKDVAL